MPDWMTELLKYGPLGIFFGLVLWGFWKSLIFVAHKVFGDESKGTKGLAGEWVEGELAWRNKLTERLEKQTDACTGHIETVRSMGESLAAQIEVAKLAQQAASLAAVASAKSNESLSHIDEVLTGRTDLIRHTAEGVAQLKGCVFHVCDLCQAFVAREFPNSVADVSAYLMAIKKKVNDETV
jgi:hypothetical protein